MFTKMAYLVEDTGNTDDFENAMLKNREPVMAYIIFLMILGILGNPLMIYFFGRHQSHRTSHIYITTLAAYDLVVSGISMPLDLVRTYIQNFFNNPYLCKTYQYFTHFACISSGCFIFAVAVERYRKICRGLMTSVRRARALVILISILSLLLSSPSAILFNVVQVNITAQYNITTYICNAELDDVYVVSNEIYMSLLLLIFIIVVSSLITLYILIYRKLRLRERAGNSRYTVTMAAITVCYILCYLPYITFNIWLHQQKGYVLPYSPRAEYLTYALLTRSILINSAINPVIYGFLNSGFQNFVWSLMKRTRKCCPKRGNMTTNEDPLINERTTLFNVAKDRDEIRNIRTGRNKDRDEIRNKRTGQNKDGSK